MKLFLLIFSAFLLTSEANAQSTLKFDGYYYAFDNARNDSSWHYLRFYPDGTVLEVNSIARPGKIMAGFKKNSSPTIFQGTYTLKGNDLQFSVSDKMKQKIAYKGTISGNTLQLLVHSFASGCEAKETYKFIPIEGLD